MEQRASYYTTPLWVFNLSYDILSQRNGYADWQTMVDFYADRAGAFDTFLYPEEIQATNMPFAIADGSSPSYQLLWTYDPMERWNNSFQGYIPTPYILGLPTIWGTKNGVTTNYSAGGINWCPYSDDSSQWSHAGVSIGSSSMTDPGSGSSTVWSFSPTGAPIIFQVMQDRTITGTFTLGVYMKVASGSAVPVTLSDNAGNSSIVSVTTAWQLFQFTTTGTGSVANPLFNIQVPGGMAGQTINMQRAQIAIGSVQAYAAAKTTGAIGGTGARDFTFSPKGLVTFTAAPVVGTILNWSGYMAWRVRFGDDSLSFNEFFQNFWELKSLNLVTVKS
jgi:hypothetical protein